MKRLPDSLNGRSTAIVVVLAISSIASACSGNSKLSKQDLKIAASDLRSLSNASHLLLEQGAAGDTTDTFLHSQADLLAEKFSSVADGVDGAGGEYEADRMRLREIATALGNDLKEPTAGSAPHIEALGRDALTIEEKLKE